MRPKASIPEQGSGERRFPKGQRDLVADPEITSKRHLARRRVIVLVIISLAYLMTRYGNLGRELTFEEGFFLAPGFEFFHAGHYHVYWGVLDPSLDPFHKPPLCSLLLGLFSFASFDPVAGARLVPFLAGWVACIVPFLVTDSWLPSVLVLLSPFLYGASSQLQTDPTGVLAGYSLISLAVARWEKEPAWSSRIALIGGLIVLWLTRIESGAMAATGLAIAVLIVRSGRARLLKDAAIGTAAGIVLVIGICSVLARTTGIAPGSALASVFGTVTRIVSSTVGRHSAVAGSGSQSRLVLFHLAESFKLPQMILLCWVPPVAILSAQRRLHVRMREFAAPFALFVVPLTATFAIGYVGDGFPRYLLIIIPPSLLALGCSLQEMTTRARALSTVAIVLLAMVSMGPTTWNAMWSPGSPNALRGESGSRDAARIALAFTKENDVVLAPEGEVFYLRGRKVLNIEAFEPYPERHPLARPYAPLLRAAIVRKAAPSAMVDELVGSLESRGATRTDVGSSYAVYVFGGAERRPPECGADAATRIESATATADADGVAHWTITGQCWDAHPKVEFTGHGCEGGCALPPGAISRATAMRLEGVAALPLGHYTVRVSGKTGAWSTPAALDIQPRN